MLALLDVQYLEASARAACLVAADWADAEPARTWSVDVAPIAPYEPGRFYLRELPCLLAALRDAPPVEGVVIDGYVWLDEAGSPGLGAHLHAALGGGTPVVGIAKTAFRGSPMAARVSRPSSRNPLYVTAAGMDLAVAAAHVGRMHGVFRIPTLVSWVDHVARGIPPAAT